MNKQEGIEMKNNLHSLILTLFLAFMALIMLPACSSTDDSSSTPSSAPASDEGGSEGLRCITGDDRCDEDCVVADGDCLR